MRSLLGAALIAYLADSFLLRSEVELDGHTLPLPALIQEEPTTAAPSEGAEAKNSTTPPKNYTEVLAKLEKEKPLQKQYSYKEHLETGCRGYELLDEDKEAMPPAMCKYRCSDNEKCVAFQYSVDKKCTLLFALRKCEFDPLYMVYEKRGIQIERLPVHLYKYFKVERGMNCPGWTIGRFEQSNEIDCRLRCENDPECAGTILVNVNVDGDESQVCETKALAEQNATCVPSSTHTASFKTFAETTTTTTTPMELNLTNTSFAVNGTVVQNPDITDEEKALASAATNITEAAHEDYEQTEKIMREGDAKAKEAGDRAEQNARDKAAKDAAMIAEAEARDQQAEDKEEAALKAELQAR